VLVARLEWFLIRKGFAFTASKEIEMAEVVPKKSPRTISKLTKSKKKDLSLSATFSSCIVEQNFVHFLQLSCPGPLSNDDLFGRCKQLASSPIDFISSDRFKVIGADVEVLGDVFLGTGLPVQATKVAKMPNLPSHLARLCEAKLLTPEEEKALFNRMNYFRYRAEQLRSTLDLANPSSWDVRRVEGLLKAADWYRDVIVRSNMRLVISIVKKFVNPQNSFDDLLSDGIVALLRAVEKFDVDLGFRFSTYATQVLRRNTYRQVMEKQEERQRMAGSIHENGLDVSDDQQESSMSEGRWHELRSKLTLLLDDLDRREKFIIRARFSLGGHRRIQTLQKLADKLGVSKERVRQLEKRALEKLRGMADASPLSDIDA
jgi:RNA polymerase primary sigma factor